MDEIKIEFEVMNVFPEKQAVYGLFDGKMKFFSISSGVESIRIGEKLSVFVMKNDLKYSLVTGRIG